MKTLGIDYGLARIGLAISDEMGVSAMPLETLSLKNPGDQTRAVMERVTERDVARIVVGMPLEMDGTAGPMAEQVEKFCLKLESLSACPVVRWDERLSSVAAERAVREMGGRRGKKRRQKGHLDPIAACLLLQSYLDGQAFRK